MHDDVPSGWNPPTIEAQNLANAPANAIANHRAAQRAAHAHPKAVLPQAVRGKKHGELAAGSPAAVAVDGVELSTAGQTSPAPRFEVPARGGLAGRSWRPPASAGPTVLACAHTQSSAERDPPDLGNGSPEQVGTALDAREFVPPFPAARRKDFPPAFGLHTRAKAVGHVTAAHLGLKRTLGQTRFSSTGFGAATLQAAPADVCEPTSVNGAFGAVKLEDGFERASHRTRQE